MRHPEHVTRRGLLAVAGTVAFAGCSGSTDEPSRLDLTVANERSEPIDVTVTVTGPDGERYEDETDRIEPDVSRAFEVVVGRSGRHELIVSGNGWSGSLAWNAGSCRLYDGIVRITETAVETSGECVDER